MKPLVSFIMPTYNRAYIIKNAVDSIQRQTVPNWELIIMDDGSTDDTEGLISDIGDPRISYHFQANAGPSAARNRALPLARAEWVAYLDSDNELQPKYLETMCKAFRHHPEASYGAPQVHYTHGLYLNGRRVETIDRSDEYPATLSIQDIFHRRMIFDVNGFMHKRRLITDSIKFDPTLAGMEDLDLVMQFGNYYPDGFLYVPKVLATYHQRYGSDGLVAGLGMSYKDNAAKLDAIYEKHQNDPLMQGQTWYPTKADRWRQLERDYRAGKLPPHYLFHFPNYWPKELV